MPLRRGGLAGPLRPVHKPRLLHIPRPDGLYYIERHQALESLFEVAIYWLKTNMFRLLFRSSLRSRRVAVRNCRYKSTASTTPGFAYAWSGRAVLGVAVATGVLGWGIAKFQNGKTSGNASMTAVHSQNAEVRFATVYEMQQVRQFSDTLNKTGLMQVCRQ